MGHLLAQPALGPAPGQQQLLGGWKVVREVVGQQVVVGIAVEGPVVGQAVPLAIEDPCVTLSNNALRGETRSDNRPAGQEGSCGLQCNGTSSLHAQKLGGGVLKHRAMFARGYEPPYS